MSINNSYITELFEKTANLLEIENANPFRIRAYRNAARIVSSWPQNIAEMVKKHEDLTKISGIGKDLAIKIIEIANTGTMSQLIELEKKTPVQLLKLLKIQGLGPKKVHLLYKKLGITNILQLKDAAISGKIKGIEGFGEKTEKNILEQLENFQAQEQQTKLIHAIETAESIISYLKTAKGINDIIIAGSFRRMKETVGDLDILASFKEYSEIMDVFIKYEDIAKIISKGETKSSIILKQGLQVDLRAVPEESFGAALHYFTGSKAHNIAIRTLGIKKGLKINEYGIFKDEIKIGGKKEEDIFNLLGLSFIEPQLRENLGEIEASIENRLPKLITLNDIKGDLHCHTKDTDGRNSLFEMALAAKELGYQYLAITNHSKRVSIANGLNEERLYEHISAIDNLNGKLNGIVLLKSVEVDILEDGSLDLSNEILKELDLTVCSVHYNTHLSKEKQTERIIRSMDNPYFNILGHPTGRIINERKSYEIDIEKIMIAAFQRGCFLELNAHPERLDLSDINCKMAKEIGVKIAISTDAHSIFDLNYMSFGIGQGQRGWLEPKDVLNTKNLEELKKIKNL